MLALMLSGVVGSASLVFFFSAFFAPKLHRKDDFLWSGFGFFYALVLWICAQRFTGAILLGQLAGVGLILAFAWQTLRLRAAIANQAIAEVPSFSLLDWVGGGLKRQPKAPKVQPTPRQDSSQSTPEVPVPTQKEAVTEKTVAEKAVAKVDQVLESIEAPPPVVEAVEEIVETAIAETEAIEAATSASSQPELPVPPAPPQATIAKKPKSKLFQWLFRGKKQQPVPPSTNVADVIEAIETEDEDWGEEDTVEEIVAAAENTVEELIEETIQPETIQSEDNEVIVIDGESQPVTESRQEAVGEALVETEEKETAPVMTEMEKSTEPEQSGVAEPIEVELETAGHDDETLPDTTATTETAEDSNWDELEQDFDPYLGGDDYSTKIEKD